MKTRCPLTHIPWLLGHGLVALLGPGWWDVMGEQSWRQGTRWWPLLPGQHDQTNWHDDRGSHRETFLTPCTWSDTQTHSPGTSSTALIKEVGSWSWNCSITLHVMCELMVSYSQRWQKSFRPPSSRQLLNMQMGCIYTFPLAAKSALDD